jgi:hypothetical protein
LELKKYVASMRVATEHPDKALKCTGKLSAYVPYVQRSLVWDDFDMSNKYASQDKNGVPFNFFQPVPENGTIFKRTSR